MHLELMRSLRGDAAGRLPAHGAAARRAAVPLHRPAASPSSLAVIAAVVAEYFGGLQNGLGSRITSAAANTAYARAWAYVVGVDRARALFYLGALAARAARHAVEASRGT